MHVITQKKKESNTITIRKTKLRMYFPPQSGAGTHQDRRTRRLRTRQAAKAACFD